MKFPTTGKIYSINEGNYIKFPQGVKDYIKYCQLEEGDRPYTSDILVHWFQIFTEI